MDMVFRDDENRLRNGNAPANLAAIRHMAQNLIQARKGTLSVKANLTLQLHFNPVLPTSRTDGSGWI